LSTLKRFSKLQATKHIEKTIIVSWSILSNNIFSSLEDEFQSSLLLELKEDILCVQVTMKRESDLEEFLLI
jgi:hypothetical protein